VLKNNIIAPMLICILKKFCVSFVSIVILILLPGTISAYSQDDSVPRIIEEINPKDLLPLLKMGTVVLIHKNQEGIEFATGILHIKAPIKDVWNTVIDYPSYGEYVPNIGSVEISEKVTEDTWKVKYLLKFKVLNLFSMNVNYMLEQHYKPMSEIWGVVSTAQKSDFSDVRFREYFIDDGEGNTIFVYTAYADLKSFGYLAKILYKSFPELVTPTLVSVGTLYPEAVKERIEGVKLNFNPVDVKFETVTLPESFTEISGEYFKKIPQNYRIVLFHNPAPGGVRFATGLVRVNTDADTLFQLLNSYERYPEFMSFVKHTKVINKNENHFSVKYNLSFRVIFPLDIDYTLNYVKLSPYNTCWELDQNEKHDINGEWGRLEIIPVNHSSSILAYTSYSNLVSSGFFMKLLLKHIEGFDMGLRVAMTDMIVSAYRKAGENNLQKK
jgi:ribosome-associated toxin RatA of RatAB toxin-antitoxin module